MIAKISKCGSFGGAVDYVLDKGKNAELLAGLGVRMRDNESITPQFRDAGGAQPKPFEARRAHRTRFLSAGCGTARQPADGRDRHGVSGRHGHPQHTVHHRPPPRPGTSHLHILFNRVDNEGPTISDRNDRYRSERLCKELTARHGLYFASGKENVKEHRLREPDKTKYEIYHALHNAVPRCRDWPKLTAALRREGIATEFRMRCGTSDPQGVVFTKNGYPFNGSKIDRQFSFSKSTMR